MSVEKQKYRIDEICTISRGRVMSKDYIRDNAGEFPVYSSQTENNGELGKINTYDYDGEYLTWTTDGANAGTVFYRTGKFSVTNVCGLLKIKKSEIHPRYLYYALNAVTPQYVSAGMGNPKLMSNVMAKIIVSIPPYETQIDIVNTLDELTEKFSLLMNSFDEELSLLKKQYLYWRTEILNSDNGDNWISLDELFNTRNGYTPSKSNNDFWENGSVPWFRMEDIRENGRILYDSLQHVTDIAVKGNLFPKDSIIISTSATIGEHALLKVEALANQRFTFLMLKEKYKELYDIDYLFYYCYVLGEWCKHNLNQGNFASVDMKAFYKFQFPIISVEKQKKAVEVLKNLDEKTEKLMNEITHEKELRQKQYLYYRKTLLN